jgi:ATP-dependent Lhr-like helicase
MGLASMPEVYRRIKEAGVTIVFVNTRAQAELCFQGLWRHERRQPADRPAPLAA